MRQAIPFFMLISAVSLFTFSSVPADKEAVQFFKGNLAEAQQYASEHGKIAVAFFHASWCAPCRIMEEYTLKSPELAEYVNENFVPVRIDVDEFDGYDAKQRNNIKLLPTIIMFDTRQRAVARYEETMTSEQMLKVFQSNNRDEYRQPQPALASTAKPSTAAPAHAKPTPPAKVPTASTATKPAQSKVTPPSPSTVSTSRISVTRLAPNGFGLQAGAFMDSKKAIKFADDLLSKIPTEDKILVLISNNMGTTHYHVIVGGAMNEPQARARKEKYKNLGIDTWVKNLMPK